MKGRIVASWSLALLAILAASPGAHAAFPASSNGKIAFSSNRDGDFDIYSVNADGSINADGSGLSNLTSNGATDLSPEWSADGTRVAFSSDRDGDFDVYTMDANGGNLVQVTDDPATDAEPSWDPTGNTLVFSSNRDGDFELYTVGSAGGSPSAVTDNPAQDVQPAWSPDGDRIVYTINPLGNLALIDPDGSNPQYLRTSNGNANPDWSPEAERIVFDRNGDVLVISATDGSDIALVFPGAEQAGADPAWSPDTTSVTYQVDPCPQCSPSSYIARSKWNWGGIAEIHYVTPQQGSEEAIAPDWQPLHVPNRYARPGGATPLRVPLIPEFRQCTSPNSNHAPPLDLDSCEPPQRDSFLLTMSDTGMGQGFARLVAQPGNPATPADEADVGLTVSASDVITAINGSDWTGKTIFRTQIRITDGANGPFETLPATVADAAFSLPLDCVATPSSPAGASCDAATTFDTVLPGFVREGARTIISSLSLQLLDVGLDGSIGAPASCPPTCGTGDERIFLRQGVFTP
jgi:TolB protein